MEDHLTTSQAARELGISAEQVRALIRAGRLDFVSTPLGRIIPRAAVQELKAKRAARAVDAARA